MTITQVSIYGFDSKGHTPDWFHWGIPQGNQLFHPSNLLIDHLKQTVIMEPLITD